MANLTKLVARLSPSLKNALENGVGEAIKRKSASVENAHWLYHVLFGNNPDLQQFLEGQGVSLSDLQSELERAMPMGSGEGGRQPTISGSVTKLIEQAWLEASVEMNLGQITPEVLLLTSQTPNALGARVEAIAALKPMSTDALRAFCMQQGASVPAMSTGGGGAPAGGNEDGTALQRFTVNLTQLARDGALDTVLGRTNEVSEAIDVLLRKRQNNPILLGSPGVGKTAVVEGLAQKIASGEVPEQLQGAELVALDMGLLQAGASVKGEFEERLKNVIKEVQASETPILVFIDEAHTMIGAGGTEGQNDAANLLKPALARGEFRTIGATTFAEYKKYFEKDPALSRRFQPITIDEPSRDASINILRAVAEGLSKHHGVFVREEAIKAAVDLSIRFMPSRRLPDKAISLMDTACARVALSQHARPVQIESLEEELRFVEAELTKSMSDARMFGTEEFDASALNSDIEDLQATVAERTAKWMDQKGKVAERLEAARAAMADDAAAVTMASPDGDEDEEIFVHPWVTQGTMAKLVSDWTGVPISNLGASEAERLLALEDTLRQRVIGQDAAISAISRSLKISRAGLTDTRKPIGVFMMCGPSGVGKTETALAIADQFFGGEDAVVTINMTEFKEAHKVSMLLGAAAGYVGYGKGGVLTEAVRRRPYCVLLLDEMEKAHREVQDIFFQIFDKGHISDSEGNDVDFRNTIIIMTSNAGGEAIRDYVDEADHDPTSQELTDHLRPLLLDSFSPAFIGRTELIAYRPLTPEVGSKLTEIHLNRIKGRIAAQYGASFVWDSSFVDYVVSANSDPLSGGRALEAIINNKFLPRLADECISRVIENKPLQSITVAHDGTDVVLAME